MKTIELIFNKSITRIAGNPYGKQIYNEQVKDKVDLNAVNKIIFPDNINGVSISFVQGLMYEIVEDKGKNYFKEHFELFSNNPVVNEKLQKSIRFLMKASDWIAIIAIVVSVIATISFNNFTNIFF